MRGHNYNASADYEETPRKKGWLYNFVTLLFGSNVAKSWFGEDISTADKRAAQLQSKMQYDLWNRTESVQAQVDQMKQAGINPAVMFGSGASSGSVPNINVGNSGEMINPLQEMMSLVTLVSGLRSAKADLEGKKYENEIKKAEASDAMDRVNRTRMRETLQNDLLSLNKTEQETRNKIVEKELERMPLELENLKKRNEGLDLDNASKQYQNIILKSDSEFRPQVNQAQLDYTQAQIEHMKNQDETSKRQLEIAEKNYYLAVKQFYVSSQYTAAQMRIQAAELRLDSERVEWMIQHGKTEELQDWIIRGITAGGATIGTAIAVSKYAAAKAASKAVPGVVLDAPGLKSNPYAIPDRM